MSLKPFLELEQSFVGDDILLPTPVEEPAQDIVISIDSLKKKVSSCTNCALCETRTQTVFGSGALNANLMFVGEAPGRDEDLKGEPFVGRAGQLLTKMIEAMGLSRDQVFIANILKCRPPENRNPSPYEIERCTPFLKKQLSLVSPKVICALGSFAAKTLLDTDTPISRLRGQVHQYEDISLVPTFHPAYLLRNASMKGKTWEDLKLVMKLLAET